MGIIQGRNFVLTGDLPQLATPVLTASNIGDNTAKLSWTPVSNGVSYLLERAINSSFTQDLTVVYTGGGLTITENSLTADTTFYYRVKALAPGFQDSEYSVVSFTTANEVSNYLSGFSPFVWSLLGAGSPNILVHNNGVWSANNGSNLVQAQAREIRIEPGTEIAYKYNGANSFILVFVDSLETNYVENGIGVYTESEGVAENELSSYILDIQEVIPNIPQEANIWIVLVKSSASNVDIYYSRNDETKVYVDSLTIPSDFNKILSVIYHSDIAYPQIKYPDTSQHLLPGFSYIKPLGYFFENADIYTPHHSSNYAKYTTTWLLPVGGEVAIKANVDSDVDVLVSLERENNDAVMGMGIDVSGTYHIWMVRGTERTVAEEGVMIPGNYYILKREITERLQIYTTTDGTDRILVDDGASIASILPGFTPSSPLYIQGEIGKAGNYLQGKGLIEIDNSLLVVKNALQGAVTDTGFVVSAKLKLNTQSSISIYSDVELTNLVYKSPLTDANDFNGVKFNITGLNPNTRYWWKISDFEDTVSTLTGTVKTLPTGQASYKVVVSSCAGPDRIFSNHPVFETIKNNHSDAEMFIHQGDIFYLDNTKDDTKVFDTAFDELLTWERQQDLYLTLPLSYMADDHDYGPNDSGASSPSRNAFLENYTNRIPHYPLPLHSDGVGAVCQTFAIGRVRYIMLDTRSQRIPGQTLLGQEQKQWLKDTLSGATEEIFCLGVGVPWIGTASDGWSSAATERAELMSFFVNNGFSDRMIMIAGDAHMVAIDDGTNNQGIPMFQFASLDSGPSEKGGPYNLGAYPGRGQFGILEITDSGADITVKGTGYRVSGGTTSTLVTYSKQFII